MELSDIGNNMLTNSGGNEGGDPGLGISNVFAGKKIDIGQVLLSKPVKPFFSRINFRSIVNERPTGTLVM